MPEKLHKFWQELKRRKVFGVIAMYAAVAFVIIELCNNIVEPLNLPGWTPTLIIVLLIVGFPFALIFSWIFDVTSKGIKKTEAFVTTADQKKENLQYGKILQFENSIAVLPFEDMSPQKDQEYFCDGITEEIINALTHVSNLKVIARTSSFAFKNKHEDIREIGKKLNVETIVEGSIRKDRNKLRITAQLVKVADGTHLWSEKFDREIEEIFAIQEEISLSIVRELKIKLLGNDRDAIMKRHTEDLEAYNLYLKGNYHNQMLTSEGLQKAVEYYELSLKKDPQYSLAYTGIASVFWYGSYWGGMRPNDAYPKAIKCVNEAKAIDDSLAEVYSILGCIQMNYYWNFEKSENEFKHALQLNPNSALIHIYYSLLLTLMERHEEAIIEAKKAQEIDPFSSYINSLGANALNFAGMYDEAIELCKKNLAINPNYFFLYFQLGFAYFGKSMMKESILAYEKAVELSGGIPLLLASLSGTYYANKENDKADECISKIKKKSEETYVPPMVFYLIHRNMGELDQVQKYIKIAIEEHDSWLPWFKVHPREIVRIPDEPKILILLKQAGF